MSTQVTIKGVAKVTQEFVNTINFLTRRAADAAFRLRGASTIQTIQTPDILTQAPARPSLGGDMTVQGELRQAFPQTEINTLVAKIPGNETTVGTIGDSLILAKQSDMQAKCIRACNLQFASRSTRKLQSAYRLSRHGDPNGLWQMKLNKVQSLVQRNSET